MDPEKINNICSELNTIAQEEPYALLTRIGRTFSSSVTPQKISPEAEEHIIRLLKELKTLMPYRRAAKGKKEKGEVIAEQRSLRFLVESTLNDLYQNFNAITSISHLISEVNAVNLLAMNTENLDLSTDELKMCADTEKMYKKIRIGLSLANENTQEKTFQCAWGILVPASGSIKPEPLASETEENIIDSKYEIGVAFTQGRRGSMQDRHLYGKCGPHQEFFVVGLFDGHNGARCAAYLKEHVLAALNDEIRQLGFPESSWKGRLSSKQELAIYNMLQTLFVKMDHQFKQEHPSDRSGSTALLLLVLGKRVWIVNVGDSRAIKVDKNRTIQLTDDAKVDKHRFKVGILKRGGRIVTYEDGSPARLNGRLAVARSVGDHDVGKGLSARGIVTYVHPSTIYSDSRIVIATDGLWDTGTTEEVGETVRRSTMRDMQEGRAKQKNAEKLLPKTKRSQKTSVVFPSDMPCTPQANKLATELMAKAYEAGSTDNITVIVLDFLA